MDVAVVGGGVIGLACADALAASGADVCVLEGAAATAQGSSSRANGGIRAQFTTAINIAFSQYSIEAFEAMPAEAIGLHQTGYLLVTGTERGEASLRAAVDLQRALRVETAWLDPSEIRERAPFLRMDGVRAGSFHARDGFLDPAGVCDTLHRSAVGRGGTVRTSAHVTAILTARDGFTIEAGDEVVRADVVVNAAGVEARAIARLAGSDLPVDPVRRNLAHVHDAPGPLTPMVVDLDSGVLVRREPGGGWVLAYANPDDAPGRDTRVDPRFFDDLVEQLPQRFPFLVELPIDPRQCWAGLYPETPDHHAIVGADPLVPGLLHCAGFGGHGVMHAPAAGRAIAELVATGASTTFDLHPLRPTRFAEGDLTVETAVF
jgi:sarcosine oxidase subunit beta